MKCSDVQNFIFIRVDKKLWKGNKYSYLRFARNNGLASWLAEGCLQPLSRLQKWPMTACSHLTKTHYCRGLLVAPWSRILHWWNRAACSHLVETSVFGQEFSLAKHNHGRALLWLLAAIAESPYSQGLLAVRISWLLGTPTTKDSWRLGFPSH